MADFKIGLQLYSVKDYMEKDVEATLKAVSEMGYECIEFAGYFGKTAEEMKALCQKYNLIPISAHHVHRPILEDLEGMTDYLKEVGVKYCAVPALHSEDMTTEYDKLIADFKRISEVMAQKDIKLMFHNHTIEFFNKQGDEVFIHKFFEDLKGYCGPEFDLCWVHYAGADPIEYIEKYKADEEIVHLMDFDCTKLPEGNIYELEDGKGLKYGVERNKAEDGFESRPVGFGRQNIPKLLEAIEKTNIKYVIIENEVWHEDPTDTETTLSDAKKIREYLKSIGY